MAIKTGIKSFVGALLIAFMVSCGSSEPATETGEPERPETRPLLEIPEEVVEEYVSEGLSDFEKLLMNSRSSLADQFSETGLMIPEIYLREVVHEEREIDEYAGFRVQILSTRDMAEADSTRDQFIAWADSVLTGYEPDAYVIFRSPNYRVRAGDFRDRNQAIHFSRLLKAKYPDAWVVHDRIEPQSVPADTAEIKFREVQIPVLNVESE